MQSPPNSLGAHNCSELVSNDNCGLRSSKVNAQVVHLPNFDPSHTFESGQAFRWNRNSSRNTWEGVISECIVTVNKSGVAMASFRLGNQKYKEIDESIRRYFSEGDDLNRIISTFPKDPYLQSAVNEYSGLRLLTQDPWECLISFVCSINSNIPSIKLKIENLCRRFGREIPNGESNQIFTFPDARSLARASKQQLLACKLGFRWRYVKFIANKVESGELNLTNIQKLSYEAARSELMSEISEKTQGVGPKVADCVLLFSMRKLEAFPMDVWMMRCISNNYFEQVRDLFPSGKIQMSASKYLAVSAIMRHYFGKYAGYAQQYLYMKSRNEGRLFDVKSGLERKSKP